jgi:hypothetical protein
MGWGVLWWAGEGGPLASPAFSIAEDISVAHAPMADDFAPLGPHPDGSLAAEGR